MVPIVLHEFLIIIHKCMAMVIYVISLLCGSSQSSGLRSLCCDVGNFLKKLISGITGYIVQANKLNQQSNSLVSSILMISLIQTNMDSFLSDTTRTSCR